MDDGGTKLPTGQVATKHFCMEDLGTQLINIESVQRTIRRQVSELQEKGIDTSVHELKSLLPKLESIQAGLRQSFDAHVRPLVRHLHIFDMPDEVLQMISEVVKADCTRVSKAPRVNSHGYAILDDFDVVGTESIKSMRLTCWRFCSASSHLLLPVLSVSITNSSLAHLDEVSRHPTISKGVRSLKIRAGLYNRILVGDLREFVAIVAVKMNKDLEQQAKWMKECLERHLETLPSISGFDYAWLFEDAKRFSSYHDVLLTCDKYMTGQTLNPDEEQIVSVLRSVYEQHSGLVADQEKLLRGNSFAQIVAEAATRMPRIDEVSISNWDHMNDYCPLLAQLPGRIYHSVRLELAMHSKWKPVILNGLPYRPLDLLYQVPSALAKVVDSLTSLDIDISVATDLKLRLGKTQIKDIARVAKQLKVLQISCRWVEPAILAKQPSGNWANFPQLASCFLKAPKLRSVSLEFGDSDRNPQSSCLNAASVEPLLALLPWTELTEIRLTGFRIHYGKLRTYLEMLQPGALVILINVYLESGIWADVLDLLRGKVDGSSDVIEPGGAKDIELDACWYDHIFLDYVDTDHVVAEYLRGDRTENPLRRRSDHVPGVKCMYEGDTFEDDTDEEYSGEDGTGEDDTDEDDMDLGG
ncbi:hypothetical protein Daus18300_004154 [Diaporthe australafricana]|uniref:F-box domain-containing protein n=1 Tax=Diaporthe australafricana TaxID=127596 RepID=A0ABR3XBL6_9PEZI